MIAALPFAGIIQIRFRGSAASVGLHSQPGFPGTPSEYVLLERRQLTMGADACQTCRAHTRYCAPATGVAHTLATAHPPRVPRTHSLPRTRHGCKAEAFAPVDRTQTDLWDEACRWHSTRSMRANASALQPTSAAVPPGGAGDPRGRWHWRVGQATHEDAGIGGWAGDPRAPLCHPVGHYGQRSHTTPRGGLLHITFTTFSSPGRSVLACSIAGWPPSSAIAAWSRRVSSASPSAWKSARVVPSTWSR